MGLDVKLAHELAPLGDDDPTIPMAEAITEANRLLTLPAHERPTLPAPAPQTKSRKRKP